MKEVVPGEKRGRRRMAVPVPRREEHVSRCFGRVSPGLPAQASEGSWVRRAGAQRAQNEVLVPNSVQHPLSLAVGAMTRQGEGWPLEELGEPPSD